MNDQQLIKLDDVSSISRLEEIRKDVKTSLSENPIK